MKKSELKPHAKLMVIDTKSTDADFDRLKDDILVLAQSLNGIYEQSYVLLKPVVDDVCKHPSSISENELEHLFDHVSDIYCYNKGRKLFDKLCRTFRTIYPDSVAFYIQTNHEFYDDD